jgi:hypothetical protein
MRRRTPWLYRLLTPLVAVILTLLANSALAQPEPAPDTALPPDTPAGNQLMWVVKCLNGQDPGDLSERFSERYLKMTPREEAKELLGKLREQVFNGGKIVITKVLDARDHDISAEITGKDSERFLHVFVVLDDQTGKIAGLRFAPAGGLGRRIGNWQQLEDAANKLPGGMSFGAYEIVPRDPRLPDGPKTMRVVMDLHADRRLAMASTAHLYVIGAIAEKVKKGALTWDQKVPIKAELMSIDPGEDRLEAGKDVSVQRLVERVMNLSDNSAADHLLALAGRESVEEFMTGLNLEPEKSFPFLSTRELFKLKVAKGDLRERYAVADIPARHGLLETEVAKLLLDEEAIGAWEKPVEIERVEWFASASECCRVMMDLHRVEALAGMEPLKEALRQKRGIKLDPGVWPEVVYKGGSEPGVLNMTWLLKREDGKVFLMSVGWNNAETTLQEARAVDLAAAGARLLALEGRPKEEPKKDVKPAPPVQQ